MKKKERTDKGMSRRQALKALGRTGIALGSYPFLRDLLGSGENSWAQEAKPKYLVYGNYGGDYGQAIKKAFLDPITKKTGIALTEEVGQNPDRFAKMRLQRDNPKSDIQNFMDRFLVQASAEGLLETLNPANFKNLKDIYPNYVHDTWVPYQASSIGIVYNTKHVKKEIRSWNDIFDETFRGKAFVDDIGHFGLHALIALARLKGGSEDRIDPGFELLARFKKMTNARIISTSQEGEHVFRTEQIWIAIWQKTRATAMMKEGLPIKFVSPIEGDVAVSWGHGVVKKTKNKEWAERVLDETLDPTNQLNFIKIFPNFPTNRKIKLPPDLEVVRYSEEVLARQVQIDWNKVLPQLDQWAERWNKEIAPKT
jgi:putative spermidine/putrescine transport system substrate-binding protein